MRWTRMLLVTVVALFAIAPAARAATFTVAQFGDLQGAGCDGDGRCESIRAAVSASALTLGADTIVVPGGDFQLAQGQVLINTDVTIAGAGARNTAIRGNVNAFRAFEVAAGVTASITGVTLRGGRGTSSGPNTGFQPGGLIRNNGTLTLDRVRVTGGTATSGGGVANIAGTLTINRSLIDNNTGGGDAGGLLSFNGGTVVVRNTTITGNFANTGGGFFSWGDPGFATNHTTFEHVTIAGNSSGVNYATGDVLRMGNSIVVANSVNCQTRPTSLGGNVEGSDDCLFETRGAQGAVDETLTNLGGDTDVLALSTGSPALDLIPAGTCTATDQRGFPRPIGPACDAGAVEAGTPTPAITSPASGTTTEATTIELRGTAASYSTVVVYRNGVAVAETSASPEGQFAVSVNLDPGEQTFEVEAPGVPRASVRVVRTVPAQQTPTPTPTAVPTASPTPTPTATPVVNRTIVVAESRGTVKVKVPGSNRYIDLDATIGIPVGSEVDTRKGRVTLTSIPKAGAPPETAVFYDGLFKVTQTRGITNLTLSEPLAACPKKGRASAAAKKAKKRKLWGDGKGSFRTTGKYSAATVRGTRWLVEDSCSGTLTRVTQGSVTVKAGKITKVLRAGKRYLARPR
ncbi:hypothetical protein OJ998_21865 [Solirubrobacter taibaiensis]|nr:hypothetical protein [Solirubrobacter taibaiensis]